jgi:probable F420-dependent oxidoreductase
METSSRPLRFGAIFVRLESRSAWDALAREVEEAGYSTFLMADHQSGHAGLREWVPALPALLAAASATEQLRIGTFVINASLRDPVTLARESALMDVLSDGRFELGIGTGSDRRDFVVIGAPYGTAAARLERLNETIKILGGMWSSGPFSFKGDYYEVHDLEGFPKPAQQPHLPLMIGGSGKAVLETAARHANIVSVVPGPGRNGQSADYREAALSVRLQHIRDSAPERFDEIELNVNIAALEVTDSASEAIRQVSRDFGLPEEEVNASPYLMVGSPKGIVEKLVRCKEEHGISYFTVGPFHFQAFKEVIAEADRL